MEKSGIRTVEQLISLPKAARRLDISVRTIKRLILIRGIETFMVGKRIRIREDDLQIIARRSVNVEDMLPVNF